MNCWKSDDGRIALYCGDCLKIMPAFIEDRSIDLTITSPPYDNLRTYNGNISQWNEQKWKDIIRSLFIATKQGGVAVWVVGDATVKGSETGTSFKQALWAKECGFNLYDTMIWNKGCFSAVGSLQNRYAPVFEYMFVWSEGYPKTFNPIKDYKTKHGGKPYTGTIRNRDGSVKRMSNEGRLINQYGQRFNIWQQWPHRQKGGHPAPFPEQIAHDHIVSWSKEGDVIFDPMMGFGTTGKIAAQLNRKFVGIELDPTYFQTAVNRIKVELQK